MTQLRVLFFIFIVCNLNSTILVNKVDDIGLPSKNSLQINNQFIKPFKLKKITIAEYITDPLILYSSLWGCFALTLPLWETGKDPSGKNYQIGDNNYWVPDTSRGFDKLIDQKEIGFVFTNKDGSGFHVDYTFLNRMALEPFASNRIDPVTKTIVSYNPLSKRDEGISVFRGDVYAKNIIEPIYFTYLALYLRAKNYHPAIMITEIVLLSVLYEFTIRPFYLNSSFEQFLKNPAIAIGLAILLDEISVFLLSTPYPGLHFLGYLFNPFNVLANSRIHPMLFFDPYKSAATIQAIIKF